MTAPYTVLYTPAAVTAADFLATGNGGETPATMFRAPRGERLWAPVSGFRSVHDYVMKDPTAVYSPCAVCSGPASGAAHVANWALALRWQGAPCLLSRRRATSVLSRFEEVDLGGVPLPDDWQDPEATFYKHHASDLWYLTGHDGFQRSYEFVGEGKAPNRECTDGHTLDYSDGDTRAVECPVEPHDPDTALGRVLVHRFGGTLHVVEEP